MERDTLVGVDFLLTGFIISTLGFFLAESIPIASFGFALLVIGALILLIVPEPVPQDALKALFKDAVRNVEIILEESGLRNRAYFLKMEDGEVRAFVPITGPDGNPTPSQLADLDIAPRRFIVNHNGMRGLLLIPPGNEIVMLAKVDTGADLEEAMRTAIVEYSDLARGILVIEEDGGKVAKIQISKPQISLDSPYFNDALGTPVSCLAGCVAAVVKGAPIMITEERYDPEFIRLTLKVSEGA